MSALNDQEQDQLRRAFTLIGDEAADPSPASAPRADSRPAWRRPRARVAGALVAAAAICAAIVVGSLDGISGGQPETHSAETDRGYSLAQVMACTQIMGVGSIVSMHSAQQPHHALLTLSVEDWIKPAHGDKRITVNVLDPRPGETRTWKPGTRMLFYVFRSTKEIASVRGTTSINEARREYERVASRHDQATCPMPKTPPPGWIK